MPHCFPCPALWLDFKLLTLASVSPEPSTQPDTRWALGGNWRMNERMGIQQTTPDEFDQQCAPVTFIFRALSLFLVCGFLSTEGI